MNNGLSLNLLVTFNDVFDEKPKELLDYLKGISKNDLLKIGAFFLGFKSQGSEFSDYKIFLEMFFCEENNSIANEIYIRLNKLKEQERSNLIIINSLCFLTLFEICFDNLSEDNYQTNAEREVNIFKSILLLNQIITEKQNVAFDSTNDVETSIHLAAMSLSQSFPYSEFLNSDWTDVLACQMVKSIILFEFLDNNEKTKCISEGFLNYFECNDWQTFLRNLWQIAFEVINKNNESHLDINIPKNEDFEKHCLFLEKLKIQDNEILSDYDFKKIRSNPFYKVEKGTYRVIYGLFVIELLYKGLYFKLNDINEKLKENKLKNFRSFYCDEFSEKYLLYTILKSICKNRYIEYTGEEIKNLGINAGPDYYIRSGNNLLLFESKDILINATIKSSYDFKMYEPEFKKKLYFENKDGKVDKKAVLQIINCIENILLKKYSFDTNYKSSSINIYPILVLHDYQFNVAGLNVILNNWFQDELLKLKEKGLEIKKVKPLVIIDIDTIIYHQDLFRDKVIVWNKILDDYFHFITIKLNRKYINHEHFEMYAKRSLISFSNFISNYVSEKRIRRIPKMLMEKGMTLVNQ